MKLTNAHVAVLAIIAGVHGDISSEESHNYCCWLSYWASVVNLVRHFAVCLSRVDTIIPTSCRPEGRM
jgi:hypothetical protein